MINCDLVCFDMFCDVLFRHVLSTVSDVVVSLSIYVFDCFWIHECIIMLVYDL